MSLPALRPEEIRTLSLPAKFGTITPFFTDGRVVTLKEMNAAGLPSRMQSKWNEMLAATDSVVHGPPSPWAIPARYAYPDDTTSSDVAADVRQMVDLACRWRILGDVTGAEGAATFLDVYSNNTFYSEYPDRVNDSRLSWCYYWPCFIEAAMLIKDSVFYTSELHAQMVNTTQASRRLSLCHDSLRSYHNWGSWGTVFELASAYFLGDRVRFNLAIQQWRAQFDLAIGSAVGTNPDSTKYGVAINSVPIHEIYRQDNQQGNGTTGLHYSQFTLNAMTQAAEWARFGGEWLYDYVSPNGSTLYGFWQNVASWMCNPADYPFNTSGSPISLPRLQAFTDILHALWPEVLNALSPDSNGDGLPDIMTIYTTTLDYYGFRGSILAYRGRPLYG